MPGKLIMKKFLLALLFLASPILADTTTTRMGLVKPDESSTGWGPKVRADYDIIDSSVAILTQPNTFTGYNSFTSSVAFSSATFYQVFVNTPTYSIATDAMAIRGPMRIGGTFGSASVCNNSFANCSSLTSSILSLFSFSNSYVAIEADGAVNPTLLLQSAANRGSESIDLTNNPNLFSAKSLWIGSNYGNRFVETMNIDQSHSTFEGPVYIGTHTVTSSPKFAVVGDTTSAYSVLIGTSTNLSSTTYHVAITTNGVLQAFNASISTITVSSATISTLSNALMFYRRPTLQYVNTVDVAIETGTIGTAGMATVIFPDGTVYNESTNANLNCQVTRKANWGSAPQGGLRPTETLTNNNWLAVYVVKSTSTGTDFSIVASTWLPLQANYSTLNTFFGTNSWVYLGLIRAGDGNLANALINKFVQNGNQTAFYNDNNPNVQHAFGILMAGTNGATSLTFTYAAGIGNHQIPDNIGIVTYGVQGTNASGAVDTFFTKDSGNTDILLAHAVATANVAAGRIANIPATSGIKALFSSGSSTSFDILITSFVDNALGVGGNPLL